MLASLDRSKQVPKLLETTVSVCVCTHMGFQQFCFKHAIIVMVVLPTIFSVRVYLCGILR